jgi:hypothetical protein
MATMTGAHAANENDKIAPCAFRKSYPNVMVVQARQDWDGYNDPCPFRKFHPAWDSRCEAGSSHD